MNLPKHMYKSTITIWSDFDPASVELDILARAAIDGGSYCSGHDIKITTKEEYLKDESFPDSFFGEVEDDE